MNIFGIETHYPDADGNIRTSAIDHYRTISPLSHIKGHNVKIVKQAVSEKNAEKEWLEIAEWADLIYCSYTEVPRAYTMMRIAADLKGSKILMDIDDDLFSVAESSPVYTRYHPGSIHKFFVEKILMDADYLTVTNENLRNVFVEKGRTKPTLVLPNAIDLKFYDLPLQNRKKPDKKIRILYTGSTSHYDDLANSGFYEAAVKINKEHGELVKFIFVGMPYDDLIQVLPKGRAEFIPGNNDFPKWIELWKHQTAISDFAVAPLADTTFNKSKSPIKYFEMAAAHLPTICSDAGPYADTVTHGRTGILVNNTEDSWFNAMNLLIKDTQFRLTLGEQAYEDVKANHTIEGNAWRWEEVLAHIEQDRTRNRNLQPA